MKFVTSTNDYLHYYQLEKSLAAACSQAESATQSLKQQLTEVKSSLTSEKTERSRESANNQVIYR